MNRKPYSTNLTDAQWARIAPLIPPAMPGGHRHTVNVRDVVNALLYFVRTGCQRRNLPHEFPPWGPRVRLRAPDTPRRPERREPPLQAAPGAGSPAPGEVPRSPALMPEPTRPARRVHPGSPGPR